jgi:hypothetical protein
LVDAMLVFGVAFVWASLSLLSSMRCPNSGGGTLKAAFMELYREFVIRYTRPWVCIVVASRVVVWKLGGWIRSLREYLARRALIG